MILQLPRRHVLCQKCLAIWQHLPDEGRSSCQSGAQVCLLVVITQLFDHTPMLRFAALDLHAVHCMVGNHGLQLTQENSKLLTGILHGITAFGTNLTYQVMNADSS